MKKYLSIVAAAVMLLSACSPAQPDVSSHHKNSASSSSQAEKRTREDTVPDDKKDETPQPSDSATSAAADVTADQRTPEGAVLLYLQSFASGDISTLCKTIATFTINRLEAIGETCESAYGGSSMPEPAQHVKNLRFADNGETDDGRGRSVRVYDANSTYSFVCIEEEGSWHVDPESYSRV